MPDISAQYIECQYLAEVVYNSFSHDFSFLVSDYKFFIPVTGPLYIRWYSTGALYKIMLIVGIRQESMMYNVCFWYIVVYLVFIHLFVPFLSIS